MQIITYLAYRFWFLFEWHGLVRMRILVLRVTVLRN